MKVFLRGLLFLLVGAVIGHVLGSALAYLLTLLVTGSATFDLGSAAGYVLGLTLAFPAFSWGVSGYSKVTRGFVLLAAAGMVGYFMEHNPLRQLRFNCRCFHQMPGNCLPLPIRISR